MSVEQEVGSVIAEGLDLRAKLLPYAQPHTSDTITLNGLTLPEGRAGQELTTKSRVWLDQVEACISRWKRHRWPLIILTINSLRLCLEPRGILNLYRVSLIDSLLDELRGIGPQQRILQYQVQKEVRLALTGDELDHAEQMLALKGRHEEAILRAAGVIAGVVLERHLSFIVDTMNSRLPEKERYVRGEKDSISKYTGWLIGKKVVLQSDRIPLEGLAYIRNCCDHPAGKKLKAPTKEAVQRLIKETRQYTKTISPPAPKEEPRRQDTPEE
jgi:hypothetical protein